MRTGDKQSLRYRAQIYDLNDKWWRGEELTNFDRLKFYNLKAQLCELKKDKLTALGSRAYDEGTFWSRVIHGLEPVLFRA